MEIEDSRLKVVCTPDSRWDRRRKFNFIGHRSDHCLALSVKVIKYICKSYSSHLSNILHSKGRSFWKHCQRHNGSKGWVQLTKVTCFGHITSSNTSLDHISFSESRPSINFKILIKHQHLNKTWNSNYWQNLQHQNPDQDSTS